MFKRKKVVTWLLVILVSFSVGFISDASDNYFEISKNLDIFGKLYREINSLYVDNTNPSKLIRTGIDAMLNSLDPYTTFISEEELDDLAFMSTGQYGGIGASIGKRNNRILVLEAYEGYPAQNAGLLAGDELIKIEGKPISGQTMEVSEIRNLLRGDKGTDVRITVTREGSDTEREINITRDRIRIDNVPYYGLADDKVGFIALTGFTQDAGKEVAEAIQAMRASTPDLSGVILDLRNNPGGRLDESVKVANAFVPQNELIVETRGRMDGSKKAHLAKHAPVDTELPLIVLVNRRSASAAEIVAGSLQDMDRGIIMGERSFGKGLVQNIRPLSYNTQLKVTTAKYYTPSGRCIQAINYADRNEDGSVAVIPDSLKNAFKTRNGRTVYDGGGIEPDLKMDRTTFQTISFELSRQGLIFDFATRFTREYKEIETPRNFVISDEEYKKFVDFVKGHDFDYQTRADIQLDKLKETIKEEAYTDQLQDELKELESRLEKQKDKDLMKHKEEISRILEAEIVKRYYYEKGTIEASLDDDPYIQEAVKLLNAPASYRKVLSGK